MSATLLEGYLRAAKERRGVDVERQHVADRRRVLGPVQALERAAARIRPRLGDGVHPRLEAGRERVERRLGRALGAGRRHHAGTQLPDHLLRHVGALLRLRRIETFEDEVPFRLVGVVALQAERLDHGLVRGARREARGARCDLRCAMRGDGVRRHGIQARSRAIC